MPPLPPPSISRHSAFAAALEAEPGTDANPTLAANAILMVGVPRAEYFFLSENSRRDVVFGGMGTLPAESPSGKGLRIRGQFVLVGPGAVPSLANLPECDPLLMAGAFVRSMDPGGFLRYDLSDFPQQTLTAATWQSGARHKLIAGVVTELTIAGDAGGFPLVAFTVEGAALDPVPMAYTVPAFDNVAYPIWRGANSLQLSGVDRVVPKSISIGLNITSTPRNDANATDAHSGTAITNRVPTMSVVAEVPPLTLWDPYADRRNRISRTVTARFGQLQPSGQKVEFSMETGQTVDVADNDDSAIRVYNVNYEGARSPGGAREFFVAFR